MLITDWFKVWFHVIVMFFPNVCGESNIKYIIDINILGIRY